MESSASFGVELALFVNYDQRELFFSHSNPIVVFLTQFLSFQNQNDMTVTL